MPHAAVYIRVSPKGLPSSHFTLAIQRDACAHFIHSQGASWRIVGDAWTGEPYFLDTAAADEIERPGLERLLSRCRDRQIDAVVCLSLDRLTRDSGRALALFSELGRRGVSLYSVDDGALPIGTQRDAERLAATVAHAGTKAGDAKQAERAAQP